jgi:uncharacterized repeat protein (TIGR01451 family)
VVTCNLGTLALDETRNVVVVTQVDASALGLLTNQATVSSITFDPVIQNNQVAIDTGVVRSADIVVDLSDNPDPVSGGGILTYTLIIQNSGPSDARDVVVVDTLPEEVTLLSTDPSQGMCIGASCQLGNLGAGEDASLVIVTSVDIMEPMVITNTAEVSSLEPDPQAGNNIAIEATTVSAGANLGLIRRVLRIQ